MNIILWIIIGIGAILILWVIAIFNSIIALKNRSQEAWADIDVQLRRRYDLIPNLIQTVKGYAKHEREIFENVTKARAAAIGASGPVKQAEAENILTGALKTLFAVAENYPNLRASENFVALQNELTDTENKIQAARRFYNGVVRDFNIKIEVFPNSIVAGILGFKKKEMFEIEEKEARKPIGVKF